MSEYLKLDPVPLWGALGGFVVGLWVGLGVFVQALLIMMIADVVTGLIAAGVEGTVSSGASLRGFAKKAVQLILVMLVAWLQANMTGYLGQAFPGVEAICGAFLLTELISILENAKRTGVSLGPLERVLFVARQQQPEQPPQDERPRAMPGAPHG